MELFFIDRAGQRRRAKEKNCKFCDKAFLVRLKEHNPRLYCSNECYRNDTKAEITTQQCCWCKKDFDRETNYLKSKTSKSGLRFCTRKCKDEAQKLGGIKEIMPPHYGTGGEHNYRTLVEEAKNPICVGCGETRIYLLCVHHIDGEHSNDTDENLEIVCANCHKIRHLRYDEATKSWIYLTKVLTPRDKLGEL